MAFEQVMLCSVSAAWRTVVTASRRPIVALIGMALTGAMVYPLTSGAQSVLLRIRPHVGDTLRMKMEQRIEMRGDSTDADDDMPPMAASMRVYTRAIVSGATDAGTTLLSITDSVTIRPAIAASLPLFAQTKKSLEGKTVRLEVGDDGAISVMGAKDGRLVQRLPAMLPGKPVSPGDVWTRELSVPVSATHASTGNAKVTFRLDSLGPDGTLAYISMRGTFAHSKKEADGPRDETTGTIEGMMIVDRRLEWMTDSRTTVTLLSTVSQASGQPTHVHMKVMQSLRAMPRR